MRVAVVHDWLAEIGGAEKVTRELIDLFDADVFALVDFLSPEDRNFVLHGKHARTSFIQQMPFARKRFRWYLPFFPVAIERLDLRGFDLIVSSSYAVAKGVRKQPGQKHVCYIHTPMRFAWVDEDGYFQDHGVQGIKARLLRWVMKRLRHWDKASSETVDRFIANSENVASRVRKFYGRDAAVLLPPVDPEVFSLHEGPRSGYLVAARLVPYKRIDRIIEAFNQLPELRLTIAGDGPDLGRLRSMAGPTISFAGHLQQPDLVIAMQRSSALVCAAHEDLGLTVMEAQACGTPVIALKAGGYLETVDELHGSRFFPDTEPLCIREAVLRHETAKPDLAPLRLRHTMSPFFRDQFRERFQTLVLQVMNHA